MFDEENSKHQQAFARTVLASLVYYCVENKTRANKNLGQLLTAFDSSPNCTELTSTLDGRHQHRYGGGLSYRYRYGRKGHCEGVQDSYNCCDDQACNHLCVNGMPYFNSPEEVLGYARDGADPSKEYSTWRPKFFSQVLDNPSAFLKWCRATLAEGAGKGGKKVCTRFPKDDAVPTKECRHPYNHTGYDKDPGRYITRETFKHRLAGSYLLQWWDDLVAADYDASVLPLRVCSMDVVALVGPISDPIKQNRQASAADVADYLSKLMDAVRKFPVACGLMASGRRPDDPMVMAFVNQPRRSVADRLHNLQGASVREGWMDAMLSAVTMSVAHPHDGVVDYDPGNGCGLSMAEILGLILDLAKEQVARLRNGDPLELLPTKELVSRMHDAVTDPGTELAMEMALVFGGTPGTGEALRNLGQVALSMFGHKQFEAIRKTALNRIKATNDSIIEPFSKEN